ncbi:MAG: MBL fold metallo-hydrolase [Bdellovibrionaceae bacterium]|nr:MBL fold metallo-hydrolase [Pseudobdellovibrionaceae bacterium]
MNKNLIFQQLFDLQSSTFTYLLADRVTKQAVLIDTVIENVARDLKLIDELDLNLIYVLDTHIHADHVTGSGKIRSDRSVKTAVPKKANVPCADLNLVEGDEIHFGQFKIQVLETPGHTDASLSFVCEGMVFSGDALLIRGTGRTDFQSGSAAELFDSITKKLFILPASTKLYPGHDYNGLTSSTIDAEIKHNPRAGGGKTKDQFIQIMSELKLAYPKKIKEALPANLVCGNIGNKDVDVQFATIAAHEAQDQLAGMLVVDVRGPDEFVGELGHIHGSHQITLGESLKEFLQGYDRNESLFFVCKSGRRSAEAARMAVEMGYQKVSHLQGGIKAWSEQQLPIEK